MISKALIASNYKAGVITLTESPNGDGVVCKIEAHWFYFGGITAEGSSVEEYKRCVPEEDIVNEIFETLEDFRTSGEEFMDEYLFYESYLKEHGVHVPRGWFFNREGFSEYLEKTFTGFENCFLRQIVDNIIKYGLEHECIVEDQFANWLSAMIPEIEFGEVAMFIDDQWLTANGIKEKKRFLTSLNEKETKR